MPKKRKIALNLRKQKIDWKFIILLVGIVLVGLSVWALNQKVTYKSSAQMPGGGNLFNCSEEYRNCMGGCSTAKGPDACSGPANNRDCKSAVQRCKEGCARERRQCNQMNKTGQIPGVPQTPPQGTAQNDGGAANPETNCANFDLQTCTTGCGGELKCEGQCKRTSMICGENDGGAGN